MAKEEQPSLFNKDDIPAVHDYGGKYDDGDVGHEFPFVRGFVDEERGVSVSLAERDETLHRIARLYARRARADGLEKAVNIPAELAKLRQAHGRNLGRFVANTVAKAKYTLADERAILGPILKTDELTRAGFDEADIDTASFTTTFETRQGFGISVGDDDRQKNLRKVARTARNARTKK
jgi:hypothetical protein